MFHSLQNGLAYTLEIGVNIKIADPQNMKSQTMKVGCSCSIILKGFRFIMLRTIQLNNQVGIIAEEVNNIISNYFLPPETGRTITQKIIPKMSFLPCHILPKHICIFEIVGVSRITHR